MNASPLFSEDDLADRFSRRHGDELRYVAEHGRWMMYDGARWQPEKTLLVFDRAREICREAGAECPEKDKATRQRLASKATRAAVENMAQSDRRHAATSEQWDADPWLLNTPLGTLDLRTGVMRPHFREDFLTKITTVAPAGECPLWREFLERITARRPDLQDFLQRMAGYALTGSTREHAIFFSYGTGANGKSVFLNTLSGVLGDYAQTAPAATFTQRAHEQHPADLASLRGARLVVASEIEDGARWAESRIKSLTGGDRIAARFMRQDFFEFTPEFKLLICGNHKPGLRSVDEAIRRRLHLIPFTVTIPEGERDLQLTEKLRAEFPGILQWAIDGCLAWQCDGLNPPACVRAATDEYLAAEDRIALWLDDCCVLDRRCWSANGSLFESFGQWCERTGEQPGSQKRFSQALEDRNFEPRRTNRARGFDGIGLRDDVHTPENGTSDRCDGSPLFVRTGARAHTPITGAPVTSVTKGGLREQYARARARNYNAARVPPEREIEDTDRPSWQLRVFDSNTCK
jgi:putative DNA primase/helicase